ncbi:LysM peptidoglycan-binding domain-containing protein [Marisediminicola sp. LYQ85]|uniref:LysM peptidoglycan-binding domain-containing protein n=1 Tax=Marisediminicola sp. LYQ85 TaxID=3391062 RepID=UPI0039838093
MTSTMPSLPAALKQPSRLAKSLFSTIPIVLVGTMAMSLNLGAGLPDQDKSDERNRDKGSELGKSIREALAEAHAKSTAEAMSAPVESTTAIATPSSYTVVAGDTVSSIAGKYGLPTASVLALNGLGWKSTIFPGQVLTLTNGASAPRVTAPQPTGSVERHTVVSGDTVAGIAERYGVPTATVLSANGLSESSIIYPGGTLAIPATAPAAQTIAPFEPAVSITPAPDTRVDDTSHVISANETVASIAALYGTTASAILDANGLSWSSIIYSGRTLVIPGVPVVTSPESGVTPLTPEMAANAKTIVSVGRSLGVSDYGLVIALATAMQESSLLNLDYGDRDSLGLFQQRPSTGWGSPRQVTDPVYAATVFFGGPTNPNVGQTRGLLDIEGWQDLPVTEAAQAVQISAYPDAYAKWETSARSWLAQIG